MRPRSLLTPLAAAGLLCACTPTLRWARKDTTAETAQTTLASCALDAEARVPFGGDDASRTSHVSRLTGLCMKSQGFQQKEE